MKRQKTFDLLPGSLSILKNIQQGFQEKKKEINLLSPLKEPLSREIIVQGAHFQYIPKPIQQYILKHDWKHRYKIQQGFSISGEGAASVQLTLYIYSDDTIPDILTIFSFLLDRVPDKKILKSHYELYYYATPFLKQFPEKKGELIGEIHANSGFTTRDNPLPIYVFRKEESRRVCIHEMLHAFGFDGVHPQPGRAPVEDEECLNLLKPIQGQHLCDGNDGVRIYESLTETQATLLNVLFQNPRSTSSLKQALNQEKKHIQRKIQEINRHYGTSKENYTGYKQGVSKTISYFLFRGFLMYEIDRFIQNNLLSPQSEDYVKIIQEGIHKQGQPVKQGKKTVGLKKTVGSKRKTLKMNFSL